MELLDAASLLATVAWVLDALPARVDDVLARSVNEMRFLGGAMLTLYVIFWGVAVLRGSVTEGANELAQRAMKIGIVVGFAFNVGIEGTYSQLVYANVTSFADNATTLLFNDTVEQKMLIGQVFSIGISIAQKFFQSGIDKSGDGLLDIPAFAMGAFSAFSTASLIASAYIVLMICKVFLGILLSLGPIFISLILFENTKRMFDAWLGIVVEYVVTLVVFGFALDIVFLIAQKAVIAFLGVSTVSGIVSGLMGVDAAAPSLAEGSAIATLMLICKGLIDHCYSVGAGIGRAISINVYTGEPRR